MSSKLIDQFQADSQLVAAGAAAMSEEVGTVLAEHFAPYFQEGEQAVDWALAQKLIGRMLAKKSQGLGHVDQTLQVDRAAGKAIRAERDQVAAELRRELRSARLLLDESFDRNLSSSIFSRRKISEVRPLGLARLARETAASLRSPEVSPTRTLSGRAFPERSGLAEALDSRALQLEQMLELLAPKRKRETYGVGMKKEHLKEANAGRMRVQDLLFGIYRGAGYDHLAARLRPKRIRRAVDGMAKQEGGNVGAVAADGQQ
jgi:hypothetical protein